MRWLHATLALTLLAALSPSASAINLFGKRKDKANSPDHVRDLIATLQTAPEDGKRSAAAGELRQYDATTYPQVVAALVEALKSDRSSSVRAEAAQSLGRIRPMSLTASQALEAAVSQDSNMRVRWHARSALMFYHAPAAPKSKDGKGPDLPLPGGEPPLVAATTVPANPQLLPVPQPRATVTTSSSPRPAPPAVPVPPGIARPLPQGPSQPAVPVVAPPSSAEPPLAVPVPPQGPVLTPP
jgi:hypothetical protein